MASSSSIGFIVPEFVSVDGGTCELIPCSKANLAESLSLQERGGGVSDVLLLGSIRASVSFGGSLPQSLPKSLVIYDNFITFQVWMFVDFLGGDHGTKLELSAESEARDDW